MKKHYLNFLIILILFSFFNCKNEEEIKYSPIDKTLPQQQLDNIFSIETEHNDTIRTIRASYMENYPKKGLVFAESVFVIEYNKDKSVKSILYCDKAKIDQRKDIYICTGNVKITTDNGILKTTYLTWDKKNDKITAKNGVTLIRKNNILNGETLITNSKLNKIKITKVSAKGKINIKDFQR